MPKAKSIEIKSDEFYSPRDIIGMGFLTAKSENTRAQMILRHIRTGRLPAKNVGGDKQPRYVVRGKDLIAYRKAVMSPGSYESK